MEAKLKLEFDLPDGCLQSEVIQLFRQILVEYVSRRDPLDRYMDERYPENKGYTPTFRKHKRKRLGDSIALAIELRKQI